MSRCCSYQANEQEGADVQADYRYRHGCGIADLVCHVALQGDIGNSRKCEGDSVDPFQSSWVCDMRSLGLGGCGSDSCSPVYRDSHYVEGARHWPKCTSDRRE